MVFDVGGVLLDWNPRHLYRRLFDTEEAMEHFLATVCTPEWHEPHDRGAPTVPDCAALAEAHPELAGHIWAWAERSEEMIGGEIPGTDDVLAELCAAGVPCYGLTNMEAETFPRRRDRFTFFGRFAGVVVSGIEGVSKPHPDIYRRLLERYGLDATATLFVDDNEANLAGAAAVGLQTVRFRSAGALRRALVAAGLLEPAPEPATPRTPGTAARR